MKTMTLKVPPNKYFQDRKNGFFFADLNWFSIKVFIWGEPQGGLLAWFVLFVCFFVTEPGVSWLAAQKQKRDRIQNHLYPSSNLSKAALNVRIDLSTLTKSAKLYLAIGLPPGLRFNWIYITMSRSWSVIFTIAKSPRIALRELHSYTL